MISRLSKGDAIRLVLTYLGTGAAEPLPSNRASCDWLVPSDVKGGLVGAEIEGYVLPVSSLFVTLEWHAKGLLPPHGLPHWRKGQQTETSPSSTKYGTHGSQTPHVKKSAALRKIWCYITHSLHYVRWNLEQMLAADREWQRGISLHFFCYCDSQFRHQINAE